MHSTPLHPTPLHPTPLHSTPYNNNNKGYRIHFNYTINRSNLVDGLNGRRKTTVNHKNLVLNKGRNSKIVE